MTDLLKPHFLIINNWSFLRIGCSCAFGLDGVPANLVQVWKASFDAVKLMFSMGGICNETCA